MSCTYDNEQTDKAMSVKLQAIYSDPPRHAFYSFHQAKVDGTGGFVGSRGGDVYAPKRMCFHCGKGKAGHTEKDEAL